jgi:hypothetical protein
MVFGAVMYLDAPMAHWCLGVCMDGATRQGRGTRSDRVVGARTAWCLMIRAARPRVTRVVHP